MTTPITNMDASLLQTIRSIQQKTDSLWRRQNQTYNDSSGNPRLIAGKLPDGTYGLGLYSDANDGTWSRISVDSNGNLYVGGAVLGAGSNSTPTPTPAPAPAPAPAPSPPTDVNWVVYSWRSGSYCYSNPYDGPYWRTDTDNVYQGDYGYGAYVSGWWYGNNLTAMRTWATNNGVTDAQVSGCYIYLYRANSGGSAGEVPLYAYTCSSFDPPSVPTGQAYIGYIGSLAWGQAGWFTLGNQVGEWLLDGTSNSILIYAGTSYADYSILYGVNECSGSGALSIYI